MKLTRLFVFILVMSCTAASAQLMNVRKWRGSERDSLDKALEFFDEKMYLRAMPIFETLLRHHPKEEFLKYSYAKCALSRSDKHEEAYNYFVEIYNNNKKVPEIQYDMALAALYNYKFDEAEDYIRQYAASRHTNLEGKKAAELLKRNIENARYFLAHPTNARVVNLGPAVNTEYDEYVPAITADESALIFTYAGKKSLGGRLNENLVPDKYGNFLEDIYVSYKQNGEFQPAVPIDSLNTIAPNAAVSLNEDGSVLYIYQDLDDGHGDIYESRLHGEHFTRPEKLKGEVNSYSWDGHCSVSPDGNTLYFSSERAGGFGGRDIYRASLSLPDSSWINVVNLGDSVNTPYDDDAPFMHPDGVTLYYSSKGKNSMGGYDVFKAVINPEDFTIKKTENLGYPINSTADDIYFVMGANGTSGYYSSGKKDGYGMKDIYRVEPNFAGEQPALCLVKGSIKNGYMGVQATIKAEITSKNNKVYKTVKSNSKTGDYLISLPAGANYRLTYSYKNLPDKHADIDALNLTSYVEKIQDFNFEEKADVLLAATSRLEPQKKTEPELRTSLTAGADQVKNTATPATGKAPKPEAVKTQAGAQKESVTEAVAEAKQTVVPAGKITTPAKEPEPAEPPVAVISPPAQEVSTSSPAEIKEPNTARRTNPDAAWDFTTHPVTSTPLNLPKKTAATPASVTKTEFVPVNGPQAKALRYTEKYADVSTADMEFRIQIAAVKNDNNQPLPNQKLLGKVEKLNLNDGFIRITVGGTFKTLGEALEHNKKVVKAGQKEGFIIALYHGQRVSFEELENLGLLK